MVRRSLHRRIMVFRCLPEILRKQSANLYPAGYRYKELTERAVATGLQLKLCNLSTDGNPNFCCSDDDLCDCNTGVGTFAFELDQGESIAAVASTSFYSYYTIATESESSTVLITTGSITTSTSASVTESLATSAFSSTITTSLITSSTTSSSESGSIVAGTAPTSAIPTSSLVLKDKKDNNHSVAIGAGLGVPLGILALAVIAFLLRRDRRNRKLIREMRNGNSERIAGGNGIEEPNSNGIEKPNQNAIKAPEVQDFDDPEWKGRHSN